MDADNTPEVTNKKIKAIMAKAAVIPRPTHNNIKPINNKKANICMGEKSSFTGSLFSTKIFEVESEYLVAV